LKYEDRRQAWQRARPQGYLFCPSWLRAVS
jgi:hypothetical protein